MRILIPILALGLASCQKQAPTQEAAAPAAKQDVEVSRSAIQNANIQVATVKSETLAQVIEAPGKLTWNEDHTVSVGAVAIGKVVQVFARVGDIVTLGQALAKMHTHEVHDTRALLRSARAEKDHATSALEQAKRTEARMKRLLELKAIPEAQLEQATLDRKTAEVALRKADADVDKEVQHLTEVLEISAEDDSEPGHKHGGEADMVPIKAPAAGVVVDRKITPGTVVSLGQETFVISEPNALWCIANFPESALSRIRVGARVEIDVRAFPGRQFSGTITRLGETIDPNTRTLMVRADVNAQGVLKPEMLATIRLRLPAAPSLTVPESALQVINGKTSVFVEASAGKFVPREVEAQVLNGVAVIAAGLKEGERVATTGSYFLKGQLLREAGL